MSVGFSEYLALGPNQQPPNLLAFDAIYETVLPFPASALLPEGVWIVEMEGRAEPSGLGANFPPAVINLHPPNLLPFDTMVADGAVESRWSDSGYATEPGDSQRPDLAYCPRLLGGPAWRRSLAVEPEAGQATVEHGALELSDMDQRVSDALAAVTWEGWPTRILRGPRRWGRQADYSDFALIATATTDGLSRDSERVRVILRSLERALERPLQQERYLGTGGIEGPDELAGQTKPVALGRVRNAPVTWIDPAQGIFQWHWREVQQADSLNDHGADIPLDTSVGTGGDVADSSALESATITSGQFVTCNALGLGRVNYTLPGADIRIWGRGDAGGPDGYVESHFELFNLVARGYGAWAHGIEGATALPSGACGFYWPTGQGALNVNAAMTAIVRSCAAQWWIARDGTIQTARVSLPELGVPVLEFTEDNILSWPREETAPRLRWRQGVGYRPLVAAFEVGDLDDTIAASQIPLLTEPYQEVGAFASVTLLRRWPDALDAETFVTSFDAASDAEGVRDYIAALLGEPLQVWSFEVGLEALRLRLNDSVRIRHPRVGGGAAGKKATVIGIDNNGDDIRVSLLVRRSAS